jgi:diguanylate cyclase (GGDEF)-like protein
MGYIPASPDGAKGAQLHPMIKNLLPKLARDILAPAQLSLADFAAVLVPHGRSAAVRRHTAAIVQARVQLIAAFFAIMVPLGSLIDLLVFDLATAGRMIVLRLLSAGLFVGLAWPRPVSGSDPYPRAMVMLVLLLMTPSLFHLLSADLLNAAAHDENQKLLARLYAYLPTIVLGGLAIFPLSALEIGLLALPVMLTSAAPFLLQEVPFSLAEQGGMLWFMLMLLGVSMFSGMSQCHYMASLVHRASHDLLTGAYTRQSGDDGLKLLFRLSEMSGKPLCVAFIDLDRFKAINDDFGHAAGDAVLRAAAGHFRAGLRRSDYLIRWGGEEFVALLPDTTPESLLGLFQRLRAEGFGRRPDGTPLTASIGVACSNEPGLTTVPLLLARADRRMYEGKQQGRDCIVLTDGEPLPFPPA